MDMLRDVYCQTSVEGWTTYNLSWKWWPSDQISLLILVVLIPVHVLTMLCWCHSIYPVPPSFHSSHISIARSTDGACTITNHYAQSNDCNNNNAHGMQMVSYADVWKAKLLYMGVEQWRETGSRRGDRLRSRGTCSARGHRQLQAIAIALVVLSAGGSARIWHNMHTCMYVHVHVHVHILNREPSNWKHQARQPHHQHHIATKKTSQQHK